MLTPEHIQSVWKKIAIPFGFSLLLLVSGIVMRSVDIQSLETGGAFMCLGGFTGMLLFGSKAIQFMFYLRKHKND